MNTVKEISDDLRQSFGLDDLKASMFVRSIVRAQQVEQYDLALSLLMTAREMGNPKNNQAYLDRLQGESDGAPDL